MSLRKLIMILSATALLAGAGVAGAFASSPGHVTSGGPTATTTCIGDDDQGDEESDAATEVEQAAAKVDQEAGRQQADDQSGDDQGENGDDQGENDDCDG
jgi:hypothetical protein